jgi:hypothetical protein
MLQQQLLLQDPAASTDNSELCLPDTRLMRNDVYVLY